MVFNHLFSRLLPRDDVYLVNMKLYYISRFLSLFLDIRMIVLFILSTKVGDCFDESEPNELIEIRS